MKIGVEKKENRGKAIRVSADVARVMLGLGRPVYTYNKDVEIAAVDVIQRISNEAQIGNICFVDMPQETIA